MALCIVGLHLYKHRAGNGSAKSRGHSTELAQSAKQKMSVCKMGMVGPLCTKAARGGSCVGREAELPLLLCMFTL